MFAEILVILSHGVAFTFNDMLQFLIGHLGHCQLFPSSGDVAIPDPLMLTVDSDFNGESPQFTLTCTSTGGPATTVTWTRDSETVSGGMTVLDDPVTAQYTHTLTVAGRLGGQYQCNVSNNKPSQDTASFIVAGKCYTKLVLSTNNKCAAKRFTTRRTAVQYRAHNSFLHSIHVEIRGVV